MRFRHPQFGYFGRFVEDDRREKSGLYRAAKTHKIAREKVPKKTYIRATKFPLAAFDKALAECKLDKSWSTFEIASSHSVMLDEPERLAELLVQAA